MKILYLLLFVACASSEKFRFDNYSLFKIVPENDQQIKVLKNLQDNSLDYDFWNEPGPLVDFVNVLSSPEKKAMLEDYLNANGIKFSIPMANIQEAIDKETVKSYNRNTGRLSWDAYYPLEDINAWMEDMARAHSEVATNIVGGTTHEGRPIRGLKISHGSGRRIIFIESGIHAREWITMATTTYIINELLTSQDPEIMAMVREFDWYIFPVTNPDGYAWTHTDFRLWRKNRRPIAGSQEIGIDLNRNWNSNWLVEGVSVNPAAQNYPGLGPFSEAESRTLSTYIRSIANDIDLYLSFHSMGQLLLLPYGNTTDPLDNYFDAMNIGRRAMGALSVRYGTQYVAGNIAEAIYFATGTSVDWVKEHLRVPLTYCYEFRDRGEFGFLLPAEQIIPNALEVIDSIVEMIHQAKRFGYMNSGNGLQASILLIILVFLKVAM